MKKLLALLLILLLLMSMATSCANNDVDMPPAAPVSPPANEKTEDTLIDHDQPDTSEPVLSEPDTSEPVSSKKEEDIPEQYPYGTGYGYTTYHLTRSLDDISTVGLDINQDSLEGIETLTIYRNKAYYGFESTESASDVLGTQLEKFLIDADLKHLVDAKLNPNSEMLEDQYNPSYICKYPDKTFNSRKNGISIMLTNAEDIADADISSINDLLSDNNILSAASNLAEVDDPIISYFRSYSIRGEIFTSSFRVYQNDENIVGRAFNNELSYIDISVNADNDSVVIVSRTPTVAENAGDFPLVSYEDAVKQLETKYGVPKDAILRCELQYSYYTTDTEFYLPYYNFYFNMNYPNLIPEGIDFKLMAIGVAEILAIEDWEA